MIKFRPIIAIADENDQDVVTDYLSMLDEESLHSLEAKTHRLFLQKAFELLNVTPLNQLQNSIELTIKVNGESRTKRYEVVKPLAVKPIYELRYAMNENEHLRFTFFPFLYKGIESYVFVKVFIKTKRPPVDETDRMRDLTYDMFQNVLSNPKLYLEGEE